MVDVSYEEAAAKKAAHMLATFRDELIRKQFTDEQAFELAKVMMSNIRSAPKG